MASITMVSPRREPRRRRRNPFTKNSIAVVGLAIVLLVGAMALLAPLIAPFDPEAINLRARMQPPSAAHWFGTDELGRDILSRIMFGARPSLMVGLVSVGLATLIGSVMGLVAGFFGGAIDSVIMRFVDIMLAFPLLLLSLVIIALFGQGLTNVMVAVAVGSIPQFARVVRGSVMSVKELEYVEAARSIGASVPSIMFRHVLINALAPLIVLATVRVASAITIEAALAFLGFGDPTAATWGNIVSSGRPYMTSAPWVSGFGGLAITVTVLALNLLGDGLRDLMDPRLKRATTN